MNRFDEDRFGIQLAVTVMVLVLYYQWTEQGTRPATSAMLAVSWFAFRELVYLFTPAFQAMGQFFLDRKRCRDSQPESDPVPFWWWRKSKPDPAAEFNRFVGGFHEDAFSMEALHVLFNHFNSTGMKGYFDASEVVCLEWGEYTKEQLCEQFAFLYPGHESLDATMLDEVFEMVADQIRSRTFFYEVQHKIGSGEVFYTYLVRGF